MVDSVTGAEGYFKTAGPFSGPGQPFTESDITAEGGRGNTETYKIEIKSGNTESSRAERVPEEERGQAIDVEA
ncbi:MAG: hypothetical protein CMH76_01185 [Nitrospinae bacterium]|jgi:hypothetical protein|nr:hypothetical protein [Nitrospinota bacterium]